MVKRVNARGDLSPTDWTIELCVSRSSEESFALMSKIEAELIRTVVVTGHEICASKFSIFIRASKHRAMKILRGIEEMHVFPSESITLTRDHPFEPTPSVGPRGIKMFDVFAIPLSSGRYGYSQFLGHIDLMQADAVRVFDLVTHATIADGKECVCQAERFPPVLTLLKVAVKSFGWQPIGNVPVEMKVLQFRQSNAASVCGSGVFHDWRLWTSKSGWMEVGDLPQEHRATEVAATWSPMAIADRILTGRHLYEACF